MLRALPSALALCVLVGSLGCGGASPRASEPARPPPPITTLAEPERDPEPSGPIAVSPDVVVAPAPTCLLPPTSCTDAAPCPVRAVALELAPPACPDATIVEEVPLVTAIGGFVVAGDRAWISTDRGVLGSTASGWEPDTDARSREGTVGLVFGADAWRLPRALILSECHQPVVQCRGGHPKCAAPRPVCTPTADLVLATHGAQGTPITIPNPLAAAARRGTMYGAAPDYEALVAIAGTSARDVWVLSAERLFHWDGHAATATALDASDPIVRLVSDASGVYAATRAGQRLRAVGDAWEPLPAQPGPFLGQVIEAPPHPFVVLDEARATGPDAFWARGRVQAFGARMDLAPALVRYENGAYRTWIGAPTQRTWLRASTGPLDSLRPEVFDVVVDDARYATPMFPFVEVRWQQPRDLVRLASGELLVATPLGIFGLSGATWTQQLASEIDAIAASGDLVASYGNGALQLREAGGWCPALVPPARGGESLAVLHERAWLVSGGHLYSVDAAHSVEEWTLRIDGQDAQAERLLADGPDPLLFARTRDGRSLVTRYDGTTWSPATPIGTEPVYTAVGSSATEIRTSGARFDGHCWSHVTPQQRPLVEVPPDARVELTLVGDEEAELVVRIVRDP